MFNFASLSRRFAPAFLATQVAFAGGALLAATPPAAAAVHLIGEHEGWKAVSADEEGQKFIGAVTEMAHGGQVAFGLEDGEVKLVLTRSDWPAPVGANVAIKITLDGVTYEGPGHVAAKDVVEIGDFNEAFIRTLAHSKQAVIKVGEVTWTLDLDGFAESMADAVRLIKTAG